MDVIPSVSQPPRANFLQGCDDQDGQAQGRARSDGRAGAFSNAASVFRFRMKKRDIPSSVREKVRKTLMEYMTTRVAMFPRE